MRFFALVELADQLAFIHEIPAIDRDGSAVVVYRERRGQRQGSGGQGSIERSFANSRLDFSRMRITAEVVNWVEGAPGWETLADLNPDPVAGFFCNVTRCSM